MHPLQIETMVMNVFRKQKETFFGDVGDWVEQAGKDIYGAGDKVVSGENIIKAVSGCKQKHSGWHGYRVEGQTYQGDTAHISEKWVTQWTGSVPGECPLGWSKTGHSDYDSCVQRHDTKCKQKRNLNSNNTTNQKSCCIDGNQQHCPREFRNGIDSAACDKVKKQYCKEQGKGTQACGCINHEPGMGGDLTRCFSKKCKSDSLKLYEWKYRQCPNWVSCEQQVNISDSQKIDIGELKLQQNCGFSGQGGEQKDQLPPSVNPTTARTYHAAVIPGIGKVGKDKIVVASGVSIAMLLLLLLMLKL